jgi:hypothetical protein
MKMKKLKYLLILLLYFFLPSGIEAQITNVNTDSRKIIGTYLSAAEDTAAYNFITPPNSSKPWVYCFWLEGNVTREGITADLEAMQRAGIGGLLFMDGDMGNPPGPHRFMSESWREMFKYMVSEANRLGLKINLNNDPGWAGSGGPWVKPEQASQKVVISETIVQGPVHFDAELVQPKMAHDFYRDIAVLACPEPALDANGKFCRIENFNSTKSFSGDQDFAGVVPWPRSIPTNSQWAIIPDSQCIASARIQDLTTRMDQNGRLSWDVPDGRWIILRIGHTVAGGTTRSSQPEATGLECDKLSKSAIEAHFSSYVEKLLADVGSLADKTLVTTHVDSWEAGSGNWTDGFREEFHKRRGYDLLPYLPALNGLVVNSLEQSERFLWDYRETVTEMLLDNYAGHLKELAHEKKLNLSIEAYDGTCDDLRYAGRADEPMCEFWQRGCYTGLPLSDIVEEITSAAHVYGRPIIGAEAFTSWHGDFLDYPATLKPLGDWAFCAGVNRFCYSEWIMQPSPKRVPGLSFSFVGTVFNRSLTWWEQSKAWNEYVSRCQNMLRQGQFVADICFVAPEGAPYRFEAPIPESIRGLIPDRPAYNFDGCPAELVLNGMNVQDGRIVLPSGMSYSLLVLPTFNANDKPVMHLEKNYVYTVSPLLKVKTMTPKLLRKIKKLVEDGATVLGTRPLKSPSLVGFPESDQEITQLADELWGKNAGYDGSGEHQLGKGRLLWGTTPEQVLTSMKLPADFVCDSLISGKLNYTHRRTDAGMDIYFVANKIDALTQGTCVFRAAKGKPEFWWPQTGRIESIAVYEQAQGVTRIPLRLNPYESVFVVFPAEQTTFDPVISVTRDGQSVLYSKPFSIKIGVHKAVYGVLGDSLKTRDVTAKVQEIVDNGEVKFPTNRLCEGDDPAPSEQKKLQVEYTLDGNPHNVTVLDGENVSFKDFDIPQTTVQIQRTVKGDLMLEAWQNGQYELRTASGRELKCTVKSLIKPMELTGTWDLSFPPNWGAPAHIMLNKLIPWNECPNIDIKYFSGTATYTKKFNLPANPTGKNKRLYLDLGKVKVMAEVIINGHDLGNLWTPPFCIDITDAVKPGANMLEIKVVNLWVNRLIGDEQIPEGIVRKPDGMLKAWPSWVAEDKPNPTGRFTFESWQSWKKNDSLLESGLIGPVTLRASQKIELR